MQLAKRIDENGFFIEDTFLYDLDNLTPDLIMDDVPQGFFQPKWDGSVWVEGKDSTEIEVIRSQQTEDYFTSEIQLWLNEEAKTKGYDSILSACSYAGYINPFQIEGQKFGAWRSDVWTQGYIILDEVKNSVRTIPNIEDLLLELPQFSSY